MIMIIFILVIMLFMFIFKIPMYEFETDLWRVFVNEQSNFRTLTPKTGNYTNTFIWLHDYNEESQVAQSFFIHDKFFATNTKIVIPESPNREMNYKILG